MTWDSISPYIFGMFTPVVVGLLCRLIWRLTHTIINKNRYKEVRAVIKANGEKEIFLKGHAPKDEAELINQLNQKKSK